MNTTLQSPAGRVCVLFPQSTRGRVEGDGLKQRVKDLRLSGYRAVLVNLEQVEDMDFVAIGSLLEESRGFRQAAGRLLLVAMSESLQEKCARVGALAGLEVFRSQDDALDALAGG